MPLHKVRHAVALHALSSLLLSLGGPARAEERRGIVVAPGSLDRAIAALAQQAGIDIGSAEPGLAQVTTRGVRGRMTAAAALDRLMAGTGLTAQRVAGGGYRIVRRRPPPPPPRTPPAAVRAVAPSPRPVPEPAPPPVDIVVTAAKRETSRLRFPGALTILGPGAMPASRRGAADGMDEAIAASPILQGTALGTGRNKLFVRGVADSSFTGPTQSTAAVYYGEVPVAYNGPDPGLNLYDMDEIEVLEGPQGTLYGAGAIGGIVRLAPRPVDLSRIGADVSAGVSLTRSGEPGTDIAGMANIPIRDGILGLRAVGYRVAEGGYIDDVRRHRRDINRTTTTGGRIDLRLAPPDGWSIDAGIVLQAITAPDLQYAEHGMAPLTRASLLAQPFDQHYLLGHLVIDRKWGDGLHLVSATGLVRRDANGRFDATRAARPNVPIAYDTDEHSRLFSHETRLSRTRANGAGWLAGFALNHARDAYARMYGPPDRLRDIVGVTNRTRDMALFGEIGIALAPALTITAGGRVTRQRTDGDPIASLRATTFIRGRSVTRFDPTLGASWLVAPGIAAYARYQSGFRAGGITVAQGIGRVADLLPDTIHVAEVGLRKERRGATGIAGAIGVSVSRWRHIQADLVDRSGFPFTANLGDGHVRGIEANANWVPMAGLRLDLAMFVNDTRITDPDPVLRRPAGARLPNTPPVALSGGIAYDWATGGGSHAGVDAGWRYVGRSTVGPQAPLDIAQGDYGTAHLGAGWSRGRLRLTTTIENVLNTKGDRFAGGNPFALAARNEYTPLRPRTIRLGGSLSW